PAGLGLDLKLGEVLREAKQLAARDQREAVVDPDVRSMESDPLAFGLLDHRDPEADVALGRRPERLDAIGQRGGIEKHEPAERPIFHATDVELTIAEPAKRGFVRLNEKDRLIDVTERDRGLSDDVAIPVHELQAALPNDLLGRPPVWKPIALRLGHELVD